ncbi:hypothetical protein [Endozoicomonas sp. ALD040]|uniref:hypothetical protein n=1 Tax=Endozoicomonas sp. ALD040 TaxID=3403079 RepID=UPI003BAF11D1
MDDHSNFGHFLRVHVFLIGVVKGGWNDTIDEKLGSFKVIKGEGFTVDRDINGARNVFLKCLTR